VDAIKLFQITTPTAFSDSDKTSYTLSICQHAKNCGTAFENFNFKIFGELV